MPLGFQRFPPFLRHVVLRPGPYAAIAPTSGRPGWPGAGSNASIRAAARPSGRAPSATSNRVAASLVSQVPSALWHRAVSRSILSLSASQNGSSPADGSILSSWLVQPGLTVQGYPFSPGSMAQAPSQHAGSAPGCRGSQPQLPARSEHQAMASWLTRTRDQRRRKAAPRRRPAPAHRASSGSGPSRSFRTEAPGARPVWPSSAPRRASTDPVRRPSHSIKNPSRGKAPPPSPPSRG